VGKQNMALFEKTMKMFSPFPTGEQRSQEPRPEGGKEAQPGDDAALRELGCGIALDDFGAGFTSLRHLQALAVDTVKIDGSFVRNLGQNYDNQVFLRHLVGLANGLGLATVAECVETAHEAAILRREGVGFLQGYYFGKPSIERAWAKAAAPALAAQAG